MLTEIQITDYVQQRDTLNMYKRERHLYSYCLKITSKHKLFIHYSVSLYFSRHFNQTTSTITFSKLQTSKEGIRYAHLPLQDRCEQAKTFSPMEKMDDNHCHFMELYKANYTE